MPNSIMNDLAPFTLIFLAALLAGTALRLWLGLRQIRYVLRHQDQVPAPFAAIISREAHRKAADYTSARARLGLVSTLWDAALLVILLPLGGLQSLYATVNAHITPGMARELALLAALGLVLFVAQLPLNLYQRFRLEARFGFNRMTPRLYLLDLLKGLMLIGVLGAPLAAGVLWIMQAGGAWWWAWAWALWAGFTLILFFIYPTLIAPRFNRFVPLDNPALIDRIRSLAQACGFTLSSVMVMDASKRSNHGNAYLTGLGRNKRIVVFDTLLERIDDDELLAVLAHELGHFHHGHIPQRLLLNLAGAALVFAMLGYAASKLGFYTSLGVYPDLTQPSPALALIVFTLVLPVFSFFIEPLHSAYSRHHEFQADRYAARQASARDLVDALIKLYQDNAATLTPDPLYTAVYASHPPAMQRVARLQALHSPT